MAELGISFKFSRNANAMIDDHTGQVLAPVTRQGNTYYVRIPIALASISPSVPAETCEFNGPIVSLDWVRELRKRLAEAHPATITTGGRAKHSEATILIHQIGNHIVGMHLPSSVVVSDCNFNCTACLLGKTTCSHLT